MALPLHAVEPVLHSADTADDLLTRSVLPSADHPLETLLRQALDVPGAAAALLEAFAAQSRALRLVQEADARGAASLPAELRQRLAAAVNRTPSWLAASGAGVRA
ncbi:MAG TPA: hypothetical protein VE861_12570 [Gemmatimonadaceae bacterium]|nr:hypothetical protein [Gemmatimonadaceae bacterium]